MDHKQRKHEGRYKNGEGKTEKPFTRAEAKAAMARFETLARHLLTVSKEQVEDGRRRAENETPGPQEPVK